MTTAEIEVMIASINLRAAEIDAERAAAAAEIAAAEQQLGSAYADGDTKAVNSLERRLTEVRAIVARAAGALAVLAWRRHDAEQQLDQQRLQDARAVVIELEAQALSGLRASVAQSDALLATWARLEDIARQAGAIDAEHRNEFSFRFAGVGHHPPAWWPQFHRWLTDVRESAEKGAAA